MDRRRFLKKLGIGTGVVVGAALVVPELLKEEAVVMPNPVAEVPPGFDVEKFEGIWEQMQKSNTRQFKIITGREGAKQFDEAIKALIG